MKLYGKSILLNLALWAGIVLALFFIVSWLWKQISDAVAAFFKAWLGGKGSGTITDAVAAAGKAADSTARALGVNVDAVPSVNVATDERTQYNQQRSIFAKLNGLTVSDDNGMNAAGWPSIDTWVVQGQVVIQGFTWGPDVDTSTYLGGS